jgi:hypothetical protein
LGWFYYQGLSGSFVSLYFFSILIYSESEGASETMTRRRATKELTETELEEMLAAAGQAIEVKAVPVEVVSSNPDELTTAEKQKRKRLEKTVEKAFYLAGLALKELRDLRLYRDTHRTFENYCRERFGHSRQKANFLIVAADIYRHLTTIGCQILPANERQIRPLCLLPPDQQTEAWTTAVEEANPKIPSGRLVRSVVNQIKELHRTRTIGQ